MSLVDAGRHHVGLCDQLAQGTPQIDEGIAKATEWLSAEDLRRADTNEDTAFQFLYAPIGEHRADSFHSVYGRYLFGVSILWATVESQLTGPLGRMAGEFSAATLEELIMASLESRRDQFAWDGIELLDASGDMLGMALYKVSARSIHLMIRLKWKLHGSSSVDPSSNETEMETLRNEIRQLLPIARVQCADDENKMAQLDYCEELVVTGHPPGA